MCEVSCVQYGRKWERTKEEAQRTAVLRVFKLVRKRGFYPIIFQAALGHFSSGHVHVGILADPNDYRYICGCCKEAQKPVPTKKGDDARFVACNCKDCVACDPDIRMDMEQVTREY